MSSSVCQSLQSFLEPGLIEQSVLKLKLAPPKSNFSQFYPQPEKQENSISHHEGNNKKNGELGGWNFIEALTIPSYNHKEKSEKENVYVHPLVKPSYSILSPKSSEMCTEILGSENGVELSSNSNEFDLLLLKNQKLNVVKRSKSRKCLKKFNRNSSFPPPLSSMSGLNSVRVRPHRENGRLVIKVVSVSSSKTRFQAERVDGRLRLCLEKDLSLNCDDEVAKNEEKIGNEEDIVEEHNNVAKEEHENNGDDYGEDIGGISGKVGCEIGIGEFPKPSRCKEGRSENKGISSWGHCWVVIS